MGHISARIGLISTFFLIFCNGLMKELELGERVEADDGYVGESPYMTKSAFCGVDSFFRGG